MKRYLLAVVLAGRLLVWVCLTTGSTATAQPATLEPYVIGCLTDLTGPVRYMFAPSLEAYRAYIEELNARGGIKGHPVKLLVEDHKNDLSRATALAKRLILQDKVLALLDLGFSPNHRAILEEAKKTGVPIITHTESGTMGPEQVDIMISEGASPKGMMIGHSCGSANIKYHISIMEKGVYIAFDRLGAQAFQPDAVRQACIVGLVSIGYANRIMLSHDSIVRGLGQTFAMPSPTHIFRNIIPALEKAGVSDGDINMMIDQNPRRLFSGE